jgi:hypothetical protein
MTYIEKFEAATKPKYTKDCVIVRAIVGGYQVVQFKIDGLNKGETVVATLCGGNMGKVLAATVAGQVMKMAMIDVLKSEV